MLNKDLPEDLVIETLSRLPVKSLMRFKCVRKSWYALIKDPYFITKHLIWATSNKHHRGVFLYKHREEIKGTCVSVLSYETLDVFGDVDLLQFFPEGISAIRVFGPCNGILCLVGVYSGHYRVYPERVYEIVLWNPATRVSKMLPLTHRPVDPTFSSHFGYGFGIDLKTNDYKVVRIRKSFELMRCEVEVYNLSTDSWRVINTSPNSAYLIFIKSPRFPSYLNGFHYWWTHDHGNLEHRFLLSFDMSNEVFQEIPLPPKIKRSGFEDIAVINGSVALILLCFNWNMETYTDIWVMNESGVERTWTKMLTIGPARPKICNLIELRDDGLVVLSIPPDECLALYNPRTQELRNVQIYKARHFQVISYTETLALLVDGPQREHS